jgi:MFS family permease
VRDRGYAAALITALAYFIAATFSSSWRIEAFRAQVLLIMIPGALAVLALSVIPFPFLATLARQHERPAFFQGRYVRRDPETGGYRLRRSILGLIVLMFGIYFVDSLGFLRLLDTPVYMNTAWQSPDVRIRAFIGATHVVTALIAGVLYSKMGERQLFLWIFGIFALTHFMYVFGLRFPVGGNTGTLVEPMLYATAVSLYTVVNFAIWADISTPDTVSLNTALGVALSGWTATFISTALALQWQEQGISLLDHLNLVDALAIILFLALLLLIYFQPRRGYDHEVTQQ